ERLHRAKKPCHVDGNVSGVRGRPKRGADAFGAKGQRRNVRVRAIVAPRAAHSRSETKIAQRQRAYLRGSQEQRRLRFVPVALFRDHASASFTRAMRSSSAFRSGLARPATSSSASSFPLATK